MAGAELEDPEQVLTKETGENVETGIEASVTEISVNFYTLV